MKLIDIISVSFSKKPRDILILIPREDILYRYERVINTIKKTGYKHAVIFFNFKKKYLIIYLLFFLLKSNKIKLLTDLIFKYKLNKRKFIHDCLINYFNSVTGKILIQFMDSDSGRCDFFSNLKNSLERGKKYFINISHSISRKNILFNQLNFSYYLVFGDFSIKNLRENPFTVGETKVIKVGSLFYDKKLLNYKKEFREKEKYNVVYTSSWVNFSEDWGKHLIKNFNLFSKFIKKYGNMFNIYIKLHPLENHNYWKKLDRNIYKFNIIEKNVSFFDIMKNYDIDLHITSWSNSIIEFSLCNVPSIIIGDNEKFDDYQLHNWFERALNEDELLYKITSILSNYYEYQNKSDKFLKYALSNIGKEEDMLEMIIKKLMNDEIVPYDEILKGNSKCVE